MATKVKVFTPADFANVRCAPDAKASIVGRVVDHQIVTQTGAVRDGWTQLVEPNGWVFPGVDFVDLPQAEPGTLVCDGYQPPVGTPEGWVTGKVWSDGWYDANPFGTLNYYYKDGKPVLDANGEKVPKSLHTGADLNMKYDADANKPLYAVADGVVTTVARFPVWDYLIIVKHDPLPDGVIAYSRYAHMATINTVQGARVKRGHILGTVGNANNTMPWHLHFDLVTTDILKTRPEHWPKLNKGELERHYVNPRAFIEQYHYMKLAGG